MDGMVREVNVRVLAKWLELLSANGGRFYYYYGVKVALGNRGMTVEAARQCAKDRNSGEP